jgi:hypothetical protein
MRIADNGVLVKDCQDEVSFSFNRSLWRHSDYRNSGVHFLMQEY